MSSGRRIVDVIFFMQQMKDMLHEKGANCGLKDVKVKSEHRKGFQSSWLLHCDSCHFEQRIYSEPTACSKPPKLDKPSWHDNVDVNTALVNGILATGDFVIYFGFRKYLFR